jgi:hypothetical protein
LYGGEAHYQPITTGDWGVDSLCNQFGLFDCIATDAKGGTPGNRGIQFSGEASVDFPQSGSVRVRARACVCLTRCAQYWLRYNDSLSGGNGTALPDVGVPSLLPANTISGWDIRAIYAAFSPLEDRMFFAFDCFGICGDADGNGNPATIWGSPPLPVGFSAYVGVLCVAVCKAWHVGTKTSLISVKRRRSSSSST